MSNLFHSSPFLGSSLRLSQRDTLLVREVVRAALCLPLLLVFFVVSATSCPEEFWVGSINSLGCGQSFVPILHFESPIGFSGRGDFLGKESPLFPAHFASFESARIEVDVFSQESVPPLAEVDFLQAGMNPKPPSIVLLGGNLFEVFWIAAGLVSAQVVSVHTFSDSPLSESHGQSMYVLPAAGYVEAPISFFGQPWPYPTGPERMVNHGALVFDPLKCWDGLHITMVNNICNNQ